MPDIDADDVHPNNNSFGEEVVHWNTHKMIRATFDYPLDDVFFADWLVWFYNLSQEQRVHLRQMDLVTLNPEDYPPLPTRSSP